MATIAVLGAGSWGTALAAQLARNGNHTRLWGRDAAAMADMAASGINRRYLPDIALPESLVCTASAQAALDGVDGILLGTPTKAFETTLELVRPYLRDDTTLVWACKGVEAGSGRLLHDVLAERLPDLRRAAVISGPSFAAELAGNLPTATTIASADAAVATQVAGWFHGENFRAYTTDDVIGVEVGGALKNVFAIAAGISDGLGFGANSRAALITRGLAELMRLGVAMGARQETLIGLSGMGDLVLTCTDDKSRNRRFGLRLAAGDSVAQALERIGQVVEGVRTAEEAQRMAAQYGVEMPIVEQVYAVIHQSKSPLDAVRELLSRSPKREV
ncbi:NAD(P)H-dependent glycerol-3-phosphate dehydrogenase [Granulosicoccaceae sp. 1_MG-2023]|nr:NAD(P)H-dependent glycerol-3-phosphate dehydrogenase [Granulosicoccaceae sp. 1_MG-2023]